MIAAKEPYLVAWRSGCAACVDWNAGFPRRSLFRRGISSRTISSVFQLLTVSSSIRS
jgi:hypothetical protein